MIKEEFDYFIKNQQQLAKEYPGKFIVIKNGAVIGVYQTEREAYNETVKRHKLGSFLIQQCLSESSVYTQTFHSMAIF
jgi:hypothetical protein